MNHVQQAYKQAYQRYTELCKESDTRQQEILAKWQYVNDDLLNDAELEQQSELITRMEFSIGIPEATRAYHNAQKELIDWGLEHVKTLPGYNPIIATLAKSTLSHHREKLADLLLKLPA